jgi:hypothetical protein
MNRTDLYERIIAILVKHGCTRGEASYLISNRKNHSNEELVAAMGNQKAVDVFNKLCDQLK